MNINDLPAYPFVESGNPAENINEGLTKRELIAAMAMQGFLANPNVSRINERGALVTSKEIYKAALHAADALLAALDNNPSNK